MEESSCDPILGNILALAGVTEKSHEHLNQNSQCLG
jgi:hypothetical protein